MDTSIGHLNSKSPLYPSLHLSDNSNGTAYKQGLEGGIYSVIHELAKIIYCAPNYNK